MFENNNITTIVLAANEVRKVPLDISPGEEKSIEVVLAKPGARVEILGNGQLKKNETFTGNIKVLHLAPQTFSRVKFRGVLFDQAQVELNGLIRIEHGAKESDGFFKADFLLFDQARAKPMPFLEILDCDVKVGHAATISKIDAEQLFYLMSRGLTRSQAKKAIIAGFLKNHG